MMNETLLHVSPAVSSEGNAFWSILWSWLGRNRRIFRVWSGLGEVWATARFKTSLSVFVTNVFVIII